MRQQNIKCPLCRLKTAVPEISFVSLDDATSNSEATDITVEVGCLYLCYDSGRIHFF